MVSPLTCSINLFVASSKIFSNPNLLSSLFLRKSSIFAFLSLVHIPSRFTLKIPRLCSAAYPFPAFASSVALHHVSSLSFLLRIDLIPKFLRSGVVYFYLSVDAVPHRMLVKPLTIYTPEYLNTCIGISPVTGKPSSSLVTSSIFSQPTNHRSHCQL